MDSHLIPLLRLGDRAAIGAALAASVRFHSPVDDYSGRADVAHLLSLIGPVLGDLRPTRELSDGPAITTFITARIEGQALDGVLDERLDERGQVVDATLLLRPLGALRVAVAAMRDGLGQDPLPSQRA